MNRDWIWYVTQTVVIVAICATIGGSFVVMSENHARVRIACIHARGNMAGDACVIGGGR